MPILLPLILAFTSVAVDMQDAGPKAPSRIAPHAESPTFDPDRPPSWWLDKMQRPCAKVSSGRASC